MPCRWCCCRQVTGYRSTRLRVTECRYTPSTKRRYYLFTGLFFLRHHYFPYSISWRLEHPIYMSHFRRVCRSGPKSAGAPASICCLLFNIIERRTPRTKAGSYYLFLVPDMIPSSLACSIIPSLHACSFPPSPSAVGTSNAAPPRMRLSAGVNVHLRGMDVPFGRNELCRRCFLLSVGL